MKERTVGSSSVDADQKDNRLPTINSLTTITFAGNNDFGSELQMWREVVDFTRWCKSSAMTTGNVCGEQLSMRRTAGSFTVPFASRNPSMQSLITSRRQCRHRRSVGDSRAPADPEHLEKNIFMVVTNVKHYSFQEHVDNTEALGDPRSS
jgi:hypothetical protein